ncbi:hypothetical protein MPER_09224 [Moniliophthora perniciosa FA553]|nr:hypothetical protein MPER_09224 [Moniliophthora perniciosa FA553]
MVQDSKHALKTFRNNLFSGARLLVLGNFTAHFRQIFEAVLDDKSPMFHRDVGSKLDKQDDNAASRLFSAANLEFFLEHRPDMLGNREISHDERLKLSLETTSPERPTTFSIL